MLFSLVLLGAGCDNATVEQKATETEDGEKMMEEMIEGGETTASVDEGEARIVLSGTPGKDLARLEWELKGDLEEPIKFRLVRSAEVNPVDNGKNYWFNQPGSRRSITWLGLGGGTQNFRICTLVNDQCEVYSNNLELTILGKVQTEETAEAEENGEETSEEVEGDSEQPEEETTKTETTSEEETTETEEETTGEITTEEGTEAETTTEEATEETVSEETETIAETTTEETAVETTEDSSSEDTTPTTKMGY